MKVKWNKKLKNSKCILWFMTWLLPLTHCYKSQFLVQKVNFQFSNFSAFCWPFSAVCLLFRQIFQISAVCLHFYQLFVYSFINCLFRFFVSLLNFLDIMRPFEIVCQSSKEQLFINGQKCPKICDNTNRPEITSFWTLLNLKYKLKLSKLTKRDLMVICWIHNV